MYYVCVARLTASLVKPISAKMLLLLFKIRQIKLPLTGSGLHAIIRIHSVTYLGFYCDFVCIPDPGTNNKKEGKKYG
jgi:hypothetical protein